MSRFHKTYIDSEGRQWVRVDLATAFRLPDGTTLLITQLHNAVLVRPDAAQVYELVPRKEGRRLLTKVLHLPYDQVNAHLPFEHDSDLTAPGEW